MEFWREPEPVSVPASLGEAVGGHPLVAELLFRRGIIDREAARAFLDPDYYPATPSELLPDMTTGTTRLLAAIRQGEAIGIWGDFDVDGQTATALLVSAFKSLGARVLFHIPVRERESHGVNLPNLTRLIDEGIDLLVTCDTGIQAHAAVDLAAVRGVETIITDHHDLPADLPAALAVINPKRLPTQHPLASLPGVGVAYKLAESVLLASGRVQEADQYLDLVALGIVADVALQTGEARYLLQKGLRTLRRTRRLGLQILMELAGLDPSGLTEEHIGFILGPRLNSLGRLSDANQAVEFLTTADAERARVLAYQLEGLNAQRRLLTDQVFQAARRQIDRDPSLLQTAALVLSHPHWPAGVIGIVASKLVELTNKPVVLFATPPGELARGSARSVEGCDISAAIAGQRDLLQSYGGHPMAAGLSLYPERIPEFRRGLSRSVQSQLGETKAGRSLQVERYLSLSELDLAFANQVERLAPFGPGNPAPVLAVRGLTIESEAVIGRRGEHRQVLVKDEDEEARPVIWWGGAGWPLPAGRFDLACRVRSSTFLGQQEVQVEWVAARQIEPLAIAVQPIQTALQVVDLRQTDHPRQALQKLQQSVAGLQVWGEAGARKEIDGHDRYELVSSPSLAIWTSPPGRQELDRALMEVSPEQIYLFAIDPHLDKLQPFLRRLAGLLKFRLREHQGWADLAHLAAATAQTEATVQAGIARLVAAGQLVVLETDGPTLRVGPGRGESGEDAGLSAARLKALLDETAAFRAYFARASAEALFPGYESLDS